MDYADTLDKALRWLRELELDKALDLLYSLLKDHPKDIELIQRIYPIELKRPQIDGFEKITQHIFSIRSTKKEFQQLIIKAFTDYKNRCGRVPTLNQEQVFCVLPHIARSHLTVDTEHLVNRIKNEYFDLPETPCMLSLYCETLTERGQFINARSELRYLITYYIETQWGQAAIGFLRMVEEKLRA